MVKSSLKLKQEKLTQLYRLLKAYEKQLNDEAPELGGRVVALLANWVYGDIKDETACNKRAPDTWFEPEEKQ